MCQVVRLYNVVEIVVMSGEVACCSVEYETLFLECYNIPSLFLCVMDKYYCTNNNTTRK